MYILTSKAVLWGGSRILGSTRSVDGTAQCFGLTSRGATLVV